jgi:hypothetical protein
MISLDAVDADSARENFEVAFKWQCASVGSSRPQLKGCGRASGDVTDTNAYLGGFDNSGGGHRTQKYVGGTSSTLVASADTVLAATDYITRFRVSGTSIKLKTWLASEPEPSEWTVETTDESLTADGWVGFFCLNTTYVYKVAFVGIATGGDTAPTEEPVSGDVTAPTLTSPTATATGSSTASGGVTTDEGNGTLYFLASANATESTTTVKTGSSQSVTATGTQSISVTGLSASTAYYLHMVHRDSSGNDSDVATSAQFTTEEASSSLTLITTGDSFNAHPTSSSVTDASTATPMVNIVVRVIYTGWRQFLFKVTGASGRRPIFKIDPTGYVNVFSSTWRPWYSYDGINWLRFDTAPVNNTTTWDFQHSEAFTDDNVWIAYQPAWPVSRTPWLIGELQGLDSSLVHELPSATGFEYATALTAQTDELGTTVPAQKMYAFGVWDDTLNPLDGSAKRIAIITGNVHAGEHIGAWPMEGFLRYLFSSTAKAITLLRNFRFYVYPMLNPMGRYMGHYRGQRDAANLTLDPNRDYPADGSASTLQSSSVFRSMLATDMGSNLAAFSLDFHSTWGSAGSFYFYSDPSVDPYAIYLDEWHARIQAYSTGYTRDASLLEVTVDQHVTRAGTQQHSYVVEVYESSAFSGGTADITLIGEHYAQALADSPLSEMRLSGLATVEYPVISATTSSSSTSTVSASVTTDTAGGIIYGLLNSSSGTLSSATIKASPSDTVTVTDAGTYELAGAGLSAGTVYYWHIVHEDADGLMSNVLSVSVTTQPEAVSGAPTWPATLPAPLVSGYGIQPNDQTIRTDMESGSPRVRRRTAARLDEYALSVSLSDAQMAIFRAWWDDDAAGGAAWFTMSLWAGDGGADSVEARFKGPWRADMIGNHRWLVSGTVEVRYA